MGLVAGLGFSAAGAPDMHGSSMSSENEQRADHTGVLGVRKGAAERTCPRQRTPELWWNRFWSQEKVG